LLADLVVQRVALEAFALEVLHAILELPPRQRIRLHRGPLLKHLPAIPLTSLSSGFHNRRCLQAAFKCTVNKLMKNAFLSGWLGGTFMRLFKKCCASTGNVQEAGSPACK
jgi:hypothetical protein